MLVCGWKHAKYRKHIHYNSDILSTEDFDNVLRPCSYYRINISKTNFRDRLTLTHQLPPSQQNSPQSFQVATLHFLMQIAVF